MGTEQQFCLRWNNHQSTLVAVFDTLLESGTLVDCTLAAEGQYLKAHKVVLSACSPYFELLLSQHYDKHPIVIMKDVKFQELKAMMDYMYRGEVNISQDQLGALLKAAESLQIKGLSDSGGGGTERESGDKRHERERRKEAPPPPPARSPPILPHSSGLTIEHRRPTQQSAPPLIVDLPEDSPPPPPLPRVSGSREGSVSPVPRKRKRHRRRSSGGEEAAPILSMAESHETSSSCELPPQTSAAPSIPATITAVVPTPAIKPTPEPPVALGQEEQTESEMNRSLPSSQVNVSSPHTMPHEPDPVQKVEPPSELLEPKAEYLDDVNEDSVEDLTLDDDMDEMDQARPGPSHGGEGSSSQGGGFPPWHVAADRSTDEVFMAAQEAVGAHRDSQVGWSSCGGYQIQPHDLFMSQSAELSGIHIKDRMEYKLPYVGSLNNESRAIQTVSTLNKFNQRSHALSEISAISQQNNVNQDDQFVCLKCGKMYRYKDSLRVHLNYHCGKEPSFLCTHCPYRSKLKADLSKHVYLKHTNPGKEDLPFACSSCGRKYKVKESLSFHIRFKCGKESLFQCQYCPYQAKLESDLTSHVACIHRNIQK